MTTFRARYILAPERVWENAVLEVRDGRIHQIHQGEAEVDLGEVAIVPGLVNAHSHAFQRAFRGRTEFLDPKRPHEDFWSWRTHMYRVAQALTPATIEVVSRMAFLEMALAGITHVGEFHYVHHAPGGAPYVDPNELAHRVIAAAGHVGIRITLLRVAYERGGHGVPPSVAQARFVDPSVDDYLERVEALRRRYVDSEMVKVGVAPHSVRALSRPWLEAIAQYALDADVVAHVHACEQRRELEECRAEHGVGPIQLLEDTGLLRPEHTLVHATHLTEHDLDLLEQRRPSICACPTTERNLGDGFLPTMPLIERALPICLGTDSQAEINLWTEARLIEYHERLRREQRNVLASSLRHALSDDADRAETAQVLWPMLGENGGRALGHSTGALLSGTPADFSVIDLANVALAGAQAEDMRSALVFSSQAGVVRDVYVAGHPIVKNGRHPCQSEIVSDFIGLVSD